MKLCPIVKAVTPEEIAAAKIDFTKTTRLNHVMEALKDLPIEYQIIKRPYLFTEDDNYIFIDEK